MYCVYMKELPNSDSTLPHLSIVYNCSYGTRFSIMSDTVISEGTSKTEHFLKSSSEDRVVSSN